MTVGIRAARGDQPVPQRTGRVISRTGAQLPAAAVGIVAQMWTPMVTAGPRFGPVVPRPSGHAEQRWAVEHRTPTLDTVTHIGGMTADTIVALAATVGELLIFLVITATAHRARGSAARPTRRPPRRAFRPATPGRRSRCTGISR